MKSPCVCTALRRFPILLTFFAAIFNIAFSCNASARNLHRNTAQTATVFQFSTLRALSSGGYDGEMTFGELLKHGDFGLGTFDALDGELIVLDGKAWRVRADGSVWRVAKNETTPFAAVTYFAPDQHAKVLSPIEYSMLREVISKVLKTPNFPYAIRVRGTFARIKVRSVPKQTRPYRALGEVVRSQSVFEWKNVRGTLVGFRFPGYLSGVNLADYHFHFISDDKTRGGHLLDGTLQSGEIATQTLRGFEMQLPHSAAFDHASLNDEPSASLKTAESNAPTSAK